MINKDFCLSSYIGLRYIFKDDADFFENVNEVIETFDYLSNVKISDIIAEIKNPQNEHPGPAAATTESADGPPK